MTSEQRNSEKNEKNLSQIMKAKNDLCIKNYLQVWAENDIKIALKIDPWVSMLRPSTWL
jgi:NADPH-dependent 7-cyano-7-deazaguanine reductase QueF